MTLESLNDLNDEQLQAVIARSQELLKQHDKERKQKALGDARAILSAAGLSLKKITKSQYKQNRRGSNAVKTGKGKASQRLSQS